MYLNDFLARVGSSQELHIHGLDCYFLFKGTKIEWDGSTDYKVVFVRATNDILYIYITVN